MHSRPRLFNKWMSSEIRREDALCQAKVETKLHHTSCWDSSSKHSWVSQRKHNIALVCRGAQCRGGGCMTWYNGRFLPSSPSQPQLVAALWRAWQGKDKQWESAANPCQLLSSAATLVSCYLLSSAAISHLMSWRKWMEKTQQLYWHKILLGWAKSTFSEQSRIWIPDGGRGCRWKQHFRSQKAFRAESKTDPGYSVSLQSCTVAPFRQWMVPPAGRSTIVHQALLLRV